MKQKILAIFLSVVMLLGMLPASIIAGAADTDTTTESTLPAGTVGYVMDVPETEQFISPKMSGITCFGWSTRLFMKKSAKNAADPINATDFSASANGNDAAYVKIIDGESYIVIKPTPYLNVDFSTSSKTETTETTDDAGITTKTEETVNTPNTTPSSNSGTYGTHNGSFTWVGISAIENKTYVSGTGDAATTKTVDDKTVGLTMIADEDESKITHLAFRVRIFGGDIGQQALFYFHELGVSDYRYVYFVDAKTGEKTYNSNKDRVILPYGDYDGYLVIACESTVLTYLKGNRSFQMYTTDTANGGWVNRTICFGDTYAVSDINAFENQFVPAPAEKDDDTAKTIFDVAGYNNLISHSNAQESFTRKESYYGIQRYYNENSADARSWKGGSYSVCENGEFFFPFTIPTQYAGTAISNFRGMAILPAMYMTNTMFYQYDENGTVLKSETGSGLMTDNKTLLDLAAYQGSDIYGEDISQYKYLAIRFKATGGEDGTTSPLGLNVGDVNAKAITDVTLVNFTTKEVTKVTDGESYLNIPKNFNGYIIVGEKDFSTSLAECTKVCFVPAILSETNNWTNKTMYLGDMEIVKDLDTFINVNGPVMFDAKAEADNKVVISNDIDTDKDALYSIDGEKWYNIDEFNDLTLEGGKRYTITAKYPWTVEDALNTKSVFNGIDTATELMTVEPGTKLSGSDGTGGLGWANANTLPNSDDTGFHTGEGGYLHATNLDGEYYWAIKDNPAHAACRQLSIYPLYKKTIGEVYADAATKYTHLAVRVRFEYDGSGNQVEGATYPVSISPLGEGTDSADYHRWSGTGTYFYDIKTGEKTLVKNGAYPSLKPGFDGYLVFPSNAVTIRDAERTQYYVDLSYMSYLRVYMHHYTEGKNCNGPNHYAGTTGNWAGTTLYIGDMSLIESDTAFLAARENCECLDIHHIKAVDAVAPTEDSNGTAAHYVCASCGETFADKAGTDPISLKALENLAFYGASLTLEQNIAVNFKVNEAQLAGFENVYAKVNFNGVEKTIRNPQLKDGKYVFTFDGVGPHLLGRTMTAQVFGTYEGIEHSSDVLEYSVKDYCYNMLEKYADATDKDELKAVLVDLLYYGEKAQLQTGTDTSSLVSADLKYSEFINRTVKVADISGGKKGIYSDLGDAPELATWKGVSLYFEETVGMMFRFATDSLDGVTVKVTDTEGNLIEEIENFTESDKGGFIAYFDGLNANEMRKTVHVSVYKNGEKVSDTLAYDVVSYAKEKIGTSYVSKRVTTKYDAEGNKISKPSEGWPRDPIAKLKVLLSYMMRYGDSVAAYAATKA